jgi:oligoribonuclease (3'-5' exoribonuclease)
LVTLSSPRSWVLRLTSYGEERMRAAPVIWEMHERSGLLEECRASDLLTHEADVQLSEYVAGSVAKLGLSAKSLMLAGSGVSHFDFRFVRRQLWQTERWLHYAPFDIGLARRVFSVLGGSWLSSPVLASSGAAKTRRALDDVLAHLEEARWVRSKLGELEALLPQ